MLEAARNAGISIHSMCYSHGHDNHPSCMICVLKDNKTGNLFPSCAIKAVAGMDLSNDDPDVKAARKDTLDLLMSDHVGDCEAPCSLACPAGMNIPMMNRLIAAGDFAGSLRVVKEEIALPFILGYICPAPCEKACRRKQVDEAVSVCLLKRFVAAEDESSGTRYLPVKATASGKKVAIIGTGPAGLAAAYYLLQRGHECVLYDKNNEAGGALRTAIPANELPREALDVEVDRIRSYGASFMLGREITKEIFTGEIAPAFHAIIIATGDITTDGNLAAMFRGSKTGISVSEGTYETSEPRVFACGSVLRAQKMSVRAVAQGKAAAIAADQFMKGMKPEKSVKRFNSRFDKLSEPEFAEYLKEADSTSRHEPFGGMLAGYCQEEALDEARRCLHCDCRKLDDCRLREYCDEYGADRKKYASGERNVIIKHFDHEQVVYEPEKCIRCGLCIDITVKSGEATGLTFMQRGYDVRVNVPFNRPMSDALTHSAVACVESCPTGALSFKKR